MCRGARGSGPLPASRADAAGCWGADCQDRLDFGDALRRGAYEGATLGWVEAGTAAIGLFAEAGAAPTFSPISERPMANYAIGINAGVAFVMPNRASSIAASLSLLVASITSAAINRAGRTESSRRVCA